MSRNRGGTMVADLFARFSADTTEYEKKMRSVVTKMLFTAESFTQAGRIMTAGITAPMAAIGIAALKMSMAFETAMTKIISLVGVGADTVKRWTPMVKKMAGEVGKSAVELAEALFFITSAGIRSDNALKVLEASAKASAVGLGETKDVAFAAVSAMNAYGEANLEAEKAVAVLIRTVREGNLEAKTLPMAFGRLLPIAAAMGIEFHEAGAGIAAMSRSGVSARLAAFGLRAVMMSLLAPTKGAGDAAEQMGLSFAHLRRVAEEDGLIYALLQMKEAADAHGRSIRDLIPSHRAFTAALQLVGKSSEDTVKIFAELKKSAKSDVQDTFNIVAKTTEVTFKQAMANLSTAAINLGENLRFLVQRLAELAETVNRAMTTFNDLPKWARTAIVDIGLFVMAIGPALYAIGSLARVTARFTGLSIMFQAGWAKNTAAIMAGEKAAVAATTKFTLLGHSMKAVAGGIVGAALVGWELGKALDDLVGFTDRINKKWGKFGETSSEIAKVWAKDQKRMQNSVTAAHSLAQKIGMLNTARQLEIAVQMNNMEVASKLVKIINEKAAAYNKAHIEVDGLTEAEEEAARKSKQREDAERQAAEARDEYNQGLRDTYDLQTSGETKQALEDLVRTEKELLADGLHRETVHENMKDAIKEQLEWAKKYNLELPEGTKELIRLLEEDGTIAVGEWQDLLERTYKEINAQPGKFMEGMVKVGDAIAENLKGGFGKGFEDGISEFDKHDERLRELLNLAVRGGFEGMGDAVREEVEQILADDFEISVSIDKQGLSNQIQDVVDGLYPDTRG